jgi:hypothetical protein
MADPLAGTAWILSGTLENHPFHNSFGVIESQKTNRHLTLPCQWFNDRAVKPKMIRPPVPPRMKEPYRFSRVVINRCHIRALVTIAEDAAASQVVEDRSTSVFPTYDVVDFMGESRSAFGV